MSSRVGAVDDVEKENDILQRESVWENPPRTPKRALLFSSSLVMVQNRYFSVSPKPKKKSSRIPSVASLAETRSSCKSDVGSVTKRGRRPEKQFKEEETRSLANGCKRTI